jgi:glycosyltransferase involved in cell wall biosynthesis
MQTPSSPEALVQSELFVSVVICTYGRSAALRDLLNSLCAQTYSKFEILVIDGNGEVSPARDIVSEFMNSAAACLDLSLIRSEKGLTRQRNVGLRTAKGDLICFLDDDVTFDPDFLARAVSLFETPGMETVGGITPYDSLNYSAPVTLRWRLRCLFGVMPSLNPGEVDRLGRAVPLSFLTPWPGRKEIGWLPGFCMVYRRAAVDGVAFDEFLPTYGGEDRDFSMRVGENWRLLICGDLFVRHEYTTQGRESNLERLRQSSFGAGRRFAKYSRSLRDYRTAAITVLGDILIDLIAIARKPVRDNFATLFLRISAFFSGLKSVKTTQKPYIREQCANSVFRIR